MDPSIVLKTPNPHLFPARRVHTLPGCSRFKRKGVLSPLLTLLSCSDTCSGLECKYSSLGTCHHFWAGSLSCLSHFWGVLGCAVQSGTAACGKVTSSYSLSDEVSLLQRAHMGRQTESPITCPALLFGVATMQEGAGILRNLHKHLSLQEHACYYIPRWVIA